MKLKYNRNIRVGFIGAGNWAEFNHMPILKEREDVELVGIATPTKKSRDRVTTNFKIQFSTSDYRELLKKPLDAVVISSPHGYHFEHAKAALEEAFTPKLKSLLATRIEEMDEAEDEKTEPVPKIYLETAVFRVIPKCLNYSHSEEYHSNRRIFFRRHFFPTNRS